MSSAPPSIVAVLLAGVLALLPGAGPATAATTASAAATSPVPAATSAVLAATSAVPGTTSPGTAASSAAAVPTPPTREAVLAAGRTALDHFYATGGGATSDAGWRWAPFFMAAEAMHRETGDVRYRDWVQSWGDRNAWTADARTSPTSNPDSRAAIQVFHDAAASGVRADLAPSDRLMAADLGLPPEQYWWVDSMFMGLPLWPRWADRTGAPAYAAKHAVFYDYLKHGGTTPWRPGCTATGLFDATEDLWWRDCKYVAQRDALGNKVFWARGNGWVLAAMARMLMELPPSDPMHAEYSDMLQRMAGRLAELQGSDGMWRSSLLSPSLHPAPETSATALFTYALAYGVRAGVLDPARYVPVVLSAWDGMQRTSLTSSGFLSNCQGVGEAPAAPSTTRSIAYCVGAFGLAATEVAQLTDHLAADSFSRTVTGGFGAAGLGGPWTVSGPTTRYGVDGGRATITPPAGAGGQATLDGVVLRDSDTRVTVGFARPRAGRVYVAVVGRRVGSASYSGRAVVAPTGAVVAQVHRSGTTVRAVTVPGLTFTTGDRLWIRVQVTGASPTTVRVKVWKAGTAEPTAWQAEATDATAGLQTSGGVGLVTYLAAGASPGSVAVAFDDLVVRRAR